MMDEKQVNIGMSWKAFQRVIYGLIKHAKNDKTAHEINVSLSKLCFCADLVIELQNKNVDFEKIIGIEKLNYLKNRYNLIGKTNTE